MLLLLWAGLVFILPNLGTLLARQIVNVPSTKALSEKRQQIWTSEILSAYSGNGGWDGRIWNERKTAMNQFAILYQDRFTRPQG